MFYAFHNAYGNGTTNTKGERLGTLHVFATKRARDAWAAADDFDGNWHREPISHDAARREAVRSFRASDEDRDLVPFLSTPELVRILTGPRYMTEDAGDARTFCTGITIHY